VTKDGVRALIVYIVHRKVQERETTREPAGEWKGNGARQITVRQREIETSVKDNLRNGIGDQQ
jgi:hypothetical protein